MRVLACTLIILVSAMSARAQDFEWVPTAWMKEGAQVRTLVVAPDGRVFAGTKEGLLLAVEEGLGWEVVGPPHINDLLFHPAGRILAGGRPGLLIAEDEYDWQELFPPFWEENCPLIPQFIYIELGIDGRIWAGANREEGGGGACKYGGVIFSSQDTAKTWSNVNAEDQYSAAVLKNGLILSGNATGFVTRRTIDGSSNDFVQISHYYVVSLLESKRGLILAATMRVSPRSMLLSTSETDIPGDLYRSHDDGVTWEVVTAPFSGTGITDIARGRDGSLLVAVHGGGVFRSLDDASTWEDISDGLQDLRVTALAIGEDGYAWAGTRDGIYRSSAPVTAVGREGELEVPGAARLIPAYPNPFAGATTIPFEVDRPDHVTIRIHDALGRQVAVLADGIFPAGRHEVKWDASAHPPGMYLIRLEAGTQRVSGMVTVLR
jgi:hypothetical protein